MTDNLNYLDIVKNQLINIGFNSKDVETYALNVIKNANANNIPIIEILDGGLVKEYITEDTINAINESRSTTSYITIRKFEPETPKFIKRNIIKNMGYSSE